MLKRIKELLKNEGYITSLGSLRGSGASCDIYENPTLSDLAEIRRQNPNKNHFGIRFLVDLNTEDVYIWDAGGALHQPVVEKLYFDKGNKPDWNNLVGGVLRLKEEDGKYIADWDSLTFKNDSKQIQKAGMLLNLYIKHDLKEEFYQGVTIPKDSMQGKISGYKEDKYVEIFKNPSKSELDKLFREYGYVRFSIEDALYVWEGDVLHASAGRISDVYQGKMFPLTV